ncbi:MAG: phosphatidylserine decarboxylase [Planctomycetota bacterium]
MPVTRHGLWEIVIGTLVLAGIATLLAWLGVWWLGLLLTVPVFVWLIAFFRDPERPLPAVEAGTISYVSPADGKVSDVTELATCPVLKEPAIRVGIFLSVFNVHVNRSPCDGTVRDVTYKKGKFINALDHNHASEHNESNTIVLEDAGTPVAVVKQIVGLIARRIVSTKQVGDRVERGDRIGMIKFGSRTELTIPKRLAPDIRVEPGQKVRGGADVLAVVKHVDGSEAT